MLAYLKANNIKLAVERWLVTPNNAGEVGEGMPSTANDAAIVAQGTRELGGSIDYLQIDMEHGQWPLSKAS